MGHSHVLIKVGLSFAQVAEQQTASSALGTEGLIGTLFFLFVNKRGRGKIAPVEHDKESIKAAIEANQSEH